MKKEQPKPKAGPTPVDNPARNCPKDEWTISNRVPVSAGMHVSLSHHRVEILEILRREPTYDVVRVRVLGPITMDRNGVTLASMPPSLLWHGEGYDTEGRFTNQRAL